MGRAGDENKSSVLGAHQRRRRACGRAHRFPLSEDGAPASPSTLTALSLKLAAGAGLAPTASQASERLNGASEPPTPSVARPATDEGQLYR